MQDTLKHIHHQLMLDALIPKEKVSYARCIVICEMMASQYGWDRTFSLDMIVNLARQENPA